MLLSLKWQGDGFSSASYVVEEVGLDYVIPLRLYGDGADAYRD